MQNSIKRTLQACVISVLVSISGIDESVAATTAAPEPSPSAMRADDADAPIAPLSPDALHSLPADGRGFEFVDGDTLKSALTRWCHSAGWTLVWRVDVDYPIKAANGFSGAVDFQTAVEQTLRAYWLQSADLKASLYSRNRYLVISGLAGRRK